jgi:hypothetical protein
MGQCPSASPDEMVVKGYPLGYETTYLRASLSDAEREALEAALRSKDAFVLRRCQIFGLYTGGRPQRTNEKKDE